MFLCLLGFGTKSKWLAKLMCSVSVTLLLIPSGLNAKVISGVAR